MKAVGSRKATLIKSTPIALGDVLPSGNLAVRQGLCTLVQPCLRRPQHARCFRFFDTTLLLVTSGQLTIDTDEASMSLSDSLSLIVMAQNSSGDIKKTPGGEDHTFRSVFLAFAPEVILEFHRLHQNETLTSSAATFGRQISFDSDLEDVLSYCLRGMQSAKVSDREQKHRLIGLLLALSDRGCYFPHPSIKSIGDRLRKILADAPAYPWTAAKASRELAMSEATLRRKLTIEKLRFETLLLDIRMHYAMTLLQTTPWSVSQIAEACGYRANSRFSSRFRERFGCSPSHVR